LEGGSFWGELQDYFVFDVTAGHGGEIGYPVFLYDGNHGVFLSLPLSLAITH
jgi:hypothetical protein